MQQCNDTLGEKQHFRIKASSLILPALMAIPALIFLPVTILSCVSVSPAEVTNEYFLVLLDVCIAVMGTVMFCRMRKMSVTVTETFLLIQYPPARLVIQWEKIRKVEERLVRIWPPTHIGIDLWPLHVLYLYVGRYQIESIPISMIKHGEVLRREIINRTSIPAAPE